MTQPYAITILFKYIRYNLILVASLLLSVNSLADNRQHMVPVSLEERSNKSDFIVEGEVISQKAFWDSKHENIYTSNIIKIFKVFKGGVVPKELELITEGGTIDLTKHVFSSALELQKGEQGIFFLQQNQPIQNTPGKTGVTTRAYANQQGFIDYNLNKGRVISDVFSEYSSFQEVYSKISNTTGQAFNTVLENDRLRQIPGENLKQEKSALAAPIISSFSPTVASAGTGTVLTINGSGFGNTRGNGKVEFRNGDDGGKTFIKPLPKEYVSWSDTQIKVFITSRGADGGTAGTGTFKVTANDGNTVTTSSQELVIEYVYSNVSLEGRTFKPILINANKLGGYTIQYAPSMQTRNAAQEGFRRAVNSWVCNTKINWEIGSPTTIEKSAEDNKNIIRFAPASETGQGVLARTISRYKGCATASDTLFWVSEFDMEINSSINWQYGPGPPVNKQYDFETVILHELGHAHQLGHVNLPRALMHYAVEFEILVRDLSDADLRGGAFVMARSTGANICKQPPIVPQLEGDCNLAPEILTFEATFQSGQVLLKWQTNQEVAVESFIVQRSEDGTIWKDIATVNSKGPSVNPLNYTYTDTKPLPDISYYRLKVIYLNKSFRFSARARVVDPASLRMLKVYPNPIPVGRHSVRLLYLVQNSTTMTINLYDSSGKAVREYSVPLSDVNAPVDLPLKGLPAGLYILKWQEGSKNGEFKILKL